MYIENNLKSFKQNTYIIIPFLWQPPKIPLKILANKEDYILLITSMIAAADRTAVSWKHHAATVSR